MSKHQNPLPAAEMLEERLAMTANPVLTGIDAAAATPPQEVNLHAGQFEGVSSESVQSVSDRYGLLGLGQTVAVIDTGIAYDHYALGGGLGEDYRVVGGYDFAEGDADPYDDGPIGFHGTHVAGIIGSDDAEYTGVASGVDLVALRVFDDAGAGDFDRIESALQWVHDNQYSFDNPITTVNMSIGADWNSDSIPEWATLEDELAQLNQDGIFVSVSAGNDFYHYQSVGLSYPAASQFVVPVASHGPDGQLSGFSQRNDRVLVAPGERITSTAPDHLFGFDGVTDDFTTSSGTSMAAPYVAGASVLVREAMQMGGHTDVTQEQIYEHFRQTADVIHDSETDASYLRINLERALQTALPSDDFSDSQPFGLGTIDSDFHLEGMINDKQDLDRFEFVASQTGTFSLDLVSHDYAKAEAYFGSDNSSAGSSLEMDVVAGQHYEFSISTSAGIGHYDATMEITPSVTVPTIDQGVIDIGRWDQPATGHSTEAQTFTAANSGWLSVAVSGGQDGAVRLVGADGVELGHAEFHGQTARFRVNAEAGDTFTLETTGTQIDSHVVVTNVVAFDGRSIDLYATDESDVFIVHTGKDVTISVNGEEYALAEGDSTSVEFHGASQDDQLWVFGTQGDDQVTVRQQLATVEGDGFHVNIAGASQYSLIGQAGDDTLTMYDSAGDDTVYGHSDFTVATGDNYRHFATGFVDTTVRSIYGGTDLAIITDSAGDDVFHLSGKSGTMEYADGQQLKTVGFDHMQVLAIKGGQDSAIVSATRSTDSFIGRPEAVYYNGSTFEHILHRFESVQVNAASQHNTALIYDSPGNDRLVLTPSETVLDGTSYSLEFRGFGGLTVLANAGGVDSATVFDSQGDDTFIGLGSLNILQGDNYRHVMQGFDSVYANATMGNDQAILYADSDGLDRLVETGTRTSLSGDKITSASGFDRVAVIGNTINNSPSGQNLDPDDSSPPPTSLPRDVESPIADPVAIVCADPGLRISALRSGGAQIASVGEHFRNEEVAMNIEDPHGAGFSSAVDEVLDETAVDSVVGEDASVAAQADVVEIVAATNTADEITLLESVFEDI